MKAHGSRKLTSQIIVNPRENINAVMVMNGPYLEVQAKVDNDKSNKVDDKLKARVVPSEEFKGECITNVNISRNVRIVSQPLIKTKEASKDTEELRTKRFNPMRIPTQRPHQNLQRRSSMKAFPTRRDHLGKIF